jgi:hypothetical protein
VFEAVAARVGNCSHAPEHHSRLQPETMKNPGICAGPIRFS